MLEWGVHPWDLSALTALIEEAGGKVTSWNGTCTIYQPDVIVSNGLVHEQARAILQQMLKEKK
jgi:fructose-1,6-bisphosphatase/inositol monophosphatase family enzyme